MLYKLLKHVHCVPNGRRDPSWCTSSPGSRNVFKKALYPRASGDDSTYHCFSCFTLGASPAQFYHGSFAEPSGLTNRNRTLTSPMNQESWSWSISFPKGKLMGNSQLREFLSSVFCGLYDTQIIGDIRQLKKRMMIYLRKPIISSLCFPVPSMTPALARTSIALSIVSFFTPLTSVENSTVLSHSFASLWE